MRKALAALCLLVVAAASAPAAAATAGASAAARGAPGRSTAGTPSPDSETFVLVRTTDGPASYRLVIDAALSDEEPVGFYAAVAARVEGDRVVRAAAAGTGAFYWDYGAKANAAGQRMELCEPVGGCIVNRTLAWNVLLDSADDGGNAANNRLYVALEGPVRISFESEGWELRELDLQYRYVESSQAESSGVFTNRSSLHLFEGATLPGGGEGSVAVGAPPCSIERTDLVPRGVGRAILTGGQSETSLTCPQNIGRPFMTALAGEATTWRMTGPVLGDSSFVNVPLFVLDLPDEDDITTR